MGLAANEPAGGAAADTPAAASGGTEPLSMNDLRHYYKLVGEVWNELKHIIIDKDGPMQTQFKVIRDPQASTKDKLLAERELLHPLKDLQQRYGETLMIAGQPLRKAGLEIAMLAELPDEEMDNVDFEDLEQQPLLNAAADAS